MDSQLYALEKRGREERSIHTVFVILITPCPSIAPGINKIAGRLAEIARLIFLYSLQYRTYQIKLKSNACTNILCPTGALSYVTETCVCMCACNVPSG